MTATQQPWTQTTEIVARALSVDPSQGLGPAEVKKRFEQYGANELQAAQPDPLWRIFARQFRSLIVVLLIAAAAVAVVFGDAHDALAIAAVIVINAAVGFTTEWKAVRSMEALRSLGHAETRVRRQGATHMVAASELVPGDIVLLEGGDLVPADLRLLTASKLQSDESALTGESMPVDKGLELGAANTVLAERRNMLYRGTAVTRGSAEGIVVATGARSEVGRIANLVQQAEDSGTPLEHRLDRLGARLVWITLAITAVITASGVAAGKEIFLMVQTGIALAVATVPEGLPIIATMALARGMWRMAQRNALINRLSAVEALGSTTIICSDKTGTLTENRMTVARLLLSGEDITLRGSSDGDQVEFSSQRGPLSPETSPVLQRALELCVLCNNAALGAASDQAAATGDPMEVALLAAGHQGGIDRASLLGSMPKLREEAFETESKKMATYHRCDEGVRVAVKGAPEAVLDVCTRVWTADGEQDLNDAARAEWLERNQRVAGDGLRVLGIACRDADSTDTEAYRELTFVGLIGLVDPPRHDVRDVIAGCHHAGMRVIMLTGDQAGTAFAIGKDLGLATSRDQVMNAPDLASLDRSDPDDRQRILDTAIFSRVSPEQKLDLIALHQQNGDIVAMTGDGVNDAPALRQADIGVAMGLRGTQVAAEAADMVLRDDSFATIVAAIEQGRVIFDNIRKFVFYLLSCNVSEVMVVALAALVQMPLPITPLQILFLNLVTDVFPALALGVGEGDPGIMDRPPRPPSEPILTKRHWWAIAGYGALLAASVLGALVFALFVLELEGQAAVTLSFLTLAFAQLWHVFNMRARRASILRNEVVRNPYVWAAIALCVALILSAVHLPGLAGLLNITAPTATGWATVISFSVIPALIGHPLQPED